MAGAVFALGCSGSTDSSASEVSTSTVSSLPTTTSTTLSPVEAQAREMLEGMTLYRKASEVFLVRFRGKTMGGDGNAELLIKDGPFGGFVFIQGNIGGWDTIHSLTTAMQALAKERGSPVQIFITTDQEGGLSRITAGVPRVPYARTLGEDSTPEEAGELAVGTAQGLHDLGFNMNLAPVADVAPRDSYIGKRSFGSDPALVSEFVAAVVKGYQENDIIAVVKHFPGHGSADGNTHDGLVLADADRETFEMVHLPPFEAAIAAGTDGIMLSHITAAAYDPDNPASRSPEMIRLLREDLGFEGLIITDSLTMMAAQKGVSPEGAAVASLKAGVDMVMAMPTAGKVISMRNAVIAAVESGELSEDRLDEAVLHVLEMKIRHGLVN